MTEISKDWAQLSFNMLVEMRGGLPDKCDFCGQAYSETRQPVPEEAGEWACTECCARWQAEGS